MASSAEIMQKLCNYRLGSIADKMHVQSNWRKFINLAFYFLRKNIKNMKLQHADNHR